MPSIIIDADSNDLPDVPAPDLRSARARELEREAEIERESAERELTAVRIKSEAAHLRAEAAEERRRLRDAARKVAADRSARKHAAIAALYSLMEHGTVGGYADAPPVDDMIAAFEGAGYELADERPSVERILSASPDSSAGRVSLRFVLPDETEIYLHATFYRMPSGRFETVAYTN